MHYIVFFVGFQYGKGPPRVARGGPSEVCRLDHAHGHHVRGPCVPVETNYHGHALEFLFVIELVHHFSTNHDQDELVFRQEERTRFALRIDREDLTAVPVSDELHIFAAVVLDLDGHKPGPPEAKVHQQHENNDNTPHTTSLS